MKKQPPQLEISLKTHCPLLKDPFRSTHFMKQTIQTENTKKINPSPLQNKTRNEKENDQSIYETNNYLGSSAHLR